MYISCQNVILRYRWSIAETSSRLTLVIDVIGRIVQPNMNKSMHTLGFSSSYVLFCTEINENLLFFQTTHFLRQQKCCHLSMSKFYLCLETFKEQIITKS